MPHIEKYYNCSDQVSEKRELFPSFQQIRWHLTWINLPVERDTAPDLLLSHLTKTLKYKSRDFNNVSPEKKVLEKRYKPWMSAVSQWKQKIQMWLPSCPSKSIFLKSKRYHVLTGSSPLFTISTIVNSFLRPSQDLVSDWQHQVSHSISLVTSFRAALK